MRRVRQFLYWLRRAAWVVWYFKIMGRKRDADKDHDCKDFENTGVDMARFIKNGRFDQQGYTQALITAGKNAFSPRLCYGDGHYMCFQCLHLDYDNSDLVPHQIEDNGEL